MPRQDDLDTLRGSGKKPQSAIERLQTLVLKETEDGRTIIRNIVSIMNGDDPHSTAHHRLQAARMLLKLGFQEAEALINSLNPKQERQAAANNPQHAHPEDNPAQQAINPQHAHPEDNPAQQAINPQHERLNKKLVARIRVETGEGASIVRILSEVMDGGDPDAKVRDRIEAAKVLLSWGFGNPSVPDPEFMSYYSPCHPDCLCVCRELEEPAELNDTPANNTQDVDGVKNVNELRNDNELDNLGETYPTAPNAAATAAPNGNRPSRSNRKPNPHANAALERAQLTEKKRQSIEYDARIAQEAAESAEQISRAHEAYLSEISHLPGNKNPRRPERSPPF